MATTKILKAAATDDEFWHIVDTRRRNRMNEIDRLPPDLRKCVHDYGWTVVRAHLDLGIKNARHLRHLVETVLNEFSPTRGSFSSQGSRADHGVSDPRVDRIDFGNRIGDKNAGS